MSKLMGADPMAQALSVRLTGNFWTEERRTIVLSLPTESGEKALHYLPTCLLACLPACLPTYLPTSTYPPTHLPAISDTTEVVCESSLSLDRP